MMRSILAVLASLIIVGTSVAEDAEAPILQIRKIADAPSSESEPMRIHGSEPVQTLNVVKAIILDQTALETATVQRNADSLAIVISFTPDGRKRFAAYTRDHLGTRLAIIIEGHLYCAPVIRSEIPGGKAEISGSFTEPEARELVAKINEAIKKR